jgi:demethylspheroidene O-methyltransferase
MSDVALPGVTDGWRDRLLGWRDRLLASERFQRWAVAFPLTRPLARRRSRALFDLVAGFVYSQVLLACVRLGLFEMLRDGPLPAAILAARMSLRPESAARLLAAAASLGLLQRRADGRFGLGPHGAALLGNPSVSAMIEHHALLYADLTDPVALLRGEQTTRLSTYWPYAGTDRPDRLEAAAVAPYSALMAATQQFIAGEVLDAYKIGRHRCLLDVGGGEGAFLAAAAARAPKLHVKLFDLPAVAARAQARFAALGLSGRAEAVGGSFLTDSLPAGADIISIVRVLHDHEDDVVHIILKSAYAALPPGGTLLVAEPMAGTEGAEPVGDAYFGFYLMAMGTGRAREAAELAEMLGHAGFTGVRQVPTHSPLLTRLLVARKPL